MRQERTARIGLCVLLLATVALTGCRFAEHGRRAAIDAFASFVLDSVSQAPLTQAAPAKTSPIAAAKPAAEPARVCTANVTVTVAAVKIAAPAVAPIALPAPQPRIASINLAPAVVEIARMKQRFACPVDIARARVEARMALAELRGGSSKGQSVRRIVVIVPDLPELPPDPATL